MSLKDDQNNKKITKKKVSVNFPIELYDILRKRTRKNGQTFRGYIVNLVAKDCDYDLGYDD